MRALAGSEIIISFELVLESLKGITCDVNDFPDTGFGDTGNPECPMRRE